MRLLALADVGRPDGYHVGDEAMLEAALMALSARMDVEACVVTGGHRASYLLQTQTVTGSGVVERARASDAMLVTGGGNLNAMHPDQLLERAAFAGLARDVGRPLVFTGQMLGPVLDQRAGTLLAAALGSANAVGVRDASSAVVARQLGVPEHRVWQTVDDASFLPADDSTSSPAGDYAAVTISPHPGLADPQAWPDIAAGMVRTTALLTGLPILLVPHVGHFGDDAVGDVAMHRRVADLVGPGVEVAPVMAGAQVAALTRSAAIVVSTRYHPVVWACAHGVPSVGVSTDEYTASKIGGALRTWGLADWHMPVLAEPAGFFAEAVAEAWQRRMEISAALSATRSSLRARQELWWDTVAGALSGDPVSTAPPPIAAEQLRAVGAWAVHARALAAWAEHLSRREDDLRLRLARVEE